MTDVFYLLTLHKCIAALPETLHDCLMDTRHGGVRQIVPDVPLHLENSRRTGSLYRHPSTSLLVRFATNAGFGHEEAAWNNHLEDLLYLYMERIALEKGCKPLLPAGVPHPARSKGR